MKILEGCGLTEGTCASSFNPYYVQLQENVDLTEADILTYLRDKIGERAAVPKEIFIVDKIPLTPVGKIFKPALRWEAIQKVYQSELEAINDLITSMKISVNEDKIHGSMVAIKINAASEIRHEQIREKVSDILARYTVKYRLEII